MRGVEQVPWLYDAGMVLVEKTGLGRWRSWLAGGVRPGRVLDLGCGTGRNLPLFPAGVRAIGLDPCHESLLAARRRAPVVPLVAELIEAMMRIHQYSMLCASIISQEAAIEALDSGEADTTEMREQYRLRRNYIVGAYNAKGLTCHRPRGSFYAFPCVRETGLSSKEFAVRLLKEEKVACLPGSAFGASGEGFLRCCFATALDQIEIAMERTARFVKRLS